MRILVGCEFSGVVRSACRRLGHDAWSCDYEAAEDGSPHHYRCDLRTLLDPWWDMLIAFPPCTDIAGSGAAWFQNKLPEQRAALDFVRTILDAPIRRIAMENPKGIISTKIRKPDQIVQPWMFGVGETKALHLWLKNLPPLTPTEVVSGREPRSHMVSERWDRWKIRSRTLPPIGEAMARQWAGPIELERVKR